MDSDTDAESDMSLLSRSFLHRVDDRVRKIQDQHPKDATQDSIKHSFIWGMFMSSTLEASVFMEKNYPENLHSIKNTGKDLTMKQMFDISEKLIAEQSDEIYGVNTIYWSDSSWKYLSLIGGEEVVSLSCAKVYVFSDSVLCFGKMSENPLSNIVWEDKLTWFKSSSEYITLDTNRWWANRVRVEYFPCSSANKVQEFLSKMSVQPEDVTGRIIFMSMFNDIPCGSQENKQECESSSQLVSICAKRFSPGRWSFLGLGSEKKWYSTLECKPQGGMGQSCRANDVDICRKQHTQFSVPRVPCPEERSKAKVVENYQYTYALLRERLKLFSAQLMLLISSVFTEQSQKCVKNMNPAM